MYHIHQIDMDVIRAWQGHRIEQKWFHCIKGAFKIQFVEIDNWDSPSQNCEIHSMELSEEKCQVLHVPGGYANGFKALKANSILMVFSNQTINEAKNDDFRFDNNYWNLSWD